MERDAILAELLEIESSLQDDRLNENDRHSLHGAQQALRNILDRDTWRPASQTFYRIDQQPTEAGSAACAGLVCATEHKCNSSDRNECVAMY